MFTTSRTRRVRRASREWGRLERLEDRRLLALLGLESATVKPDGRIVELVFAGPGGDGVGVPDWTTAWVSGSRLSTNLGTVLEPLGVVVTQRGEDLVWTTSFLVSDPSQVITFDTLSVVVSASDRLVSDDAGNWTAGFDAAAAENLSYVDAGGFTTEQFQRGAGGATIYVSDRYGNDNRSFAQARNPGTPVKTLAAAFRLLQDNDQDGRGAAVRLLRGDVFPGHVSLRIGGQDRRHPLVIEDYWYDYGDGRTDPKKRPIISSDWMRGEYSGIQARRFNAEREAGLGIDFVVIRRIELRAVRRRLPDMSSYGLGLYSGGRDWIIDDCVIRGYRINILIQGEDIPFQNVTVLRSTVLDARLIEPPPPQEFNAAQGLWTKGVTGLLVSQSVFDKNGRTYTDLSGRDLYSHNIYLSHVNGPGTLWGNVIRGGGSHGVHMRAGGILAYNYVARNALAAELSNVGGVMTRNVVEAAEDISDTLKRGAGLIISTKFGSSLVSVVQQNIVLHGASDVAKPLFAWQLGVHGMLHGVIRNNTAVNAGPATYSIEGAPAGPYHITFDANIIDAAALPAVNMRPPDPGHYEWLASDRNIYNADTLSRAFALPYVPNTDLDGWRLATGGDAQSRTFTTRFMGGSKNINDYAASIGIPGGEDVFVNRLRSRGPGAWIAANDVLRLVNYYSQNYRPANLPLLDGGTLGFYGAVDYRPSAPDLVARQDTGVSDTDNITRTNVNLKFEVSNTLSESTVQLLRNGVVVASAAGNATRLVTLTDPTTLPEGVYHYAARLVSADGSAVVGPSTRVTVDRTLPAVPAVPVLVSVENGVATFSVESTESTGIVELLRRPVGSTAPRQVVASRVGSGTIQDNTIPLPGEYEYVIRVIDLAGNASITSRVVRIWIS